MATTRVCCWIHSVPQRTRFLLEQKVKQHLEKRMTIEGICSLGLTVNLGNMVKTSQDLGKGGKKDWTRDIQNLIELQCERWWVTLGLGAFEVIFLKRNKVNSVDPKEGVKVRFWLEDWRGWVSGAPSLSLMMGIRGRRSRETCSDTEYVSSPFLCWGFGHYPKSVFLSGSLTDVLGDFIHNDNGWRYHLALKTIKYDFMN